MDKQLTQLPHLLLVEGPCSCKVRIEVLCSVEAFQAETITVCIQSYDLISVLDQLAEKASNFLRRTYTS